VIQAVRTICTQRSDDSGYVFNGDMARGHVLNPDGDWYTNGQPYIAQNAPITVLTALQPSAMSLRIASQRYVQLILHLSMSFISEN